MSFTDWFRRRPSAPAPGPMGWQGPPPAGLTGWIDDPYRYTVASTLQVFEDGWKAFSEPPGDLLLYRAWKLVFGSYPAYVKQEIGDCVSQGWSRANDLRQCHEATSGGPAYRETCTEFTYAVARRCANMLGSWQDGCFGAAAAKAAISYGFVPRTEPYSGRRAKEWGFSGPPRDLESTALRSRGVARVIDWPSLVSAIWNGMPVAVCSNQGFTLERDSAGFCRPEGVWNHCMMFAGVRFGRRPGVLCCQSWGPNVPSGPVDLDQPDFSFWVDKDVALRMLGMNDSFALMDAPDFVPARYSPSFYARGV